LRSLINVDKVPDMWPMTIRK